MNCTARKYGEKRRYSMGGTVGPPTRVPSVIAVRLTNWDGTQCYVIIGRPTRPPPGHSQYESQDAGESVASAAAEKAQPTVPPATHVANPSITMSSKSLLPQAKICSGASVSFPVRAERQADSVRCRSLRSSRCWGEVGLSPVRYDSQGCHIPSTAKNIVLSNQTYREHNV